MEDNKEAKSFSENKYWILRHGKSIPNEIGLIVSSLENGVKSEYQLASDGINQAKLAGESFLKELKESNIPLESVRICYSPFARTIHTAKVVASVLNLPFEGPQCKMCVAVVAFLSWKQKANTPFNLKVYKVVTEDLRERYFGPTFELMSHDKYPEIWALDEKDPFMQPEGGESANDVAGRLANAIEIMESKFQGCTILIVSHGDPLQILQTLVNAAKQPTETTGGNLSSRIQAVRVASILSQHRKFALLTGELRQLI